VLTSSLVLKALTYAPTGAIVAAATTSLPEELGGVRNWDYRYCWLRDATFTLYALLVGGYEEEAFAWREWLVNAVAGKPEQLHIMYGLEGERRLPELELPWLPGYEGSRPVRVGNAAHGQHQLDVYGEVMDTMYVARRMGLPTSEDSWRVQRTIMRFLERDWQRPDDGIWETRGGPQHFTHSKVMAWVAADRAVKAVDELGLPGDVERWRRLRDEIHAEVCARGFDQQLGAFVQHYGSKDPDASLLMLPVVGFLPARDPGSSGRCDSSRSGSSATASSCATPPSARSTGCPAARARSCCARSGSPTTSSCRGAMTRRWRSSSGSSPSATTSACSPRSTTPARDASSATSRRPSRTSA
jgi:GH15 family glucan-1,4-alpha-glucosidase